VVYLECGDYPGAMANVLERLAAADISVEYMYAFADSRSEFSRVIIRPDKTELANQIVQEI